MITKFIPYKETTNSSSIGQHKRCAVDIIPDEPDDLVNEDVTVSAAEDNGNYITLDIGNRRYEFTPKKDSEFDIYQLVSKFNGIRKHSHGRALAWIKKYANGKYVGTVVEEVMIKVAESKADRLESQLKSALRKIMTSTEFGFDPSNIDEYTAVEIYDGYPTRVEIRAEVDYDGLMEIARVLDPIIKKYDKDAYFDADEPGILSTYMW